MMLRAFSHPLWARGCFSLDGESCLPLAPFQHSRVFLLKASGMLIKCKTAPLLPLRVGQLQGEQSGRGQMVKGLWSLSWRLQGAGQVHRRRGAVLQSGSL